jgi:hypothetical protein
MTQVAEDRNFRAVSRARDDGIERDAPGTLSGSRQSDRSATKAPQSERIRLPLRQRYALRDAIAYAVEAPEGEIGFVTAVGIAPFDYWPHELIIEATAGMRMRVPIDTVSAVLPREGRLLVRTAPAGAQSVRRPREEWLTKARAWQFAAVAGAVLGFGGYIATFVALVLDTGVSWGPGLAASGAAGGAASAVSWRKRGPSWAAALALGSFWLPLAAGAILSLVFIFR